MEAGDFEQVVALAGPGGAGAVTAAAAFFGALHGAGSLPASRVRRLEIAWVGDQLARDAVRERFDHPAGSEYEPSPDGSWWARYPRLVKAVADVATGRGSGGAARDPRCCPARIVARDPEYAGRHPLGEGRDGRSVLEGGAQGVERRVLGPRAWPARCRWPPPWPGDVAGHVGGEEVRPGTRVVAGAARGIERVVAAPLPRADRRPPGQRSSWTRSGYAPRRDDRRRHPPGARGGRRLPARPL